MSARYPLYPNPCVVCGAQPHQRCRTVKTGRVTDTHMRRVHGEWPEGKPT